MIRAAILGPAILLAAGCACKPVEILVPCRTPAVVEPAWEFDLLAEDATLHASVTALLVEREERAAFESVLKAAIAACNF